MDKLFGSEVYGRVADRAVRIRGGWGYVLEASIEHYYRDARVYEGIPETQNIVAGRLGKEFVEAPCLTKPAGVLYGSSSGGR